MPNIIPFKSIMFNLGFRNNLDKLICPPYDILSFNDYEKYYNLDKNNIIRFEYPFSDDFNEVAELLSKYRRNSILIKDKKPSIYLCEKKFRLNSKEFAIKSLICLVKISNHDQKMILPHEKTISEIEDKRFKLLEHTLCQFTPILSIYKGENTIEKLYVDDNKKLLMEFKDKSNIEYKIWGINKFNIIKDVMHEIKNKKIYIADGHHRYNIARKLKKFYPTINGTHYTLVELIDTNSDEVIIFPTHRIIKKIDLFNKEEFIIKCKKYFKIILLDYNNKERIKSLMKKYNKENVFAFVYKKEIYLLILKDKEIMKKLLPNESEASLKLDTIVLHKLIFNHIIGVSNLELIYDRNFEVAMNASSIYGNESISFILNPTKLEQIYSISDLGDVMPQKSTYFYPKTCAGIINYEL